MSKIVEMEMETDDVDVASGWRCWPPTTGSPRTK